MFDCRNIIGAQQGHTDIVGLSRTHGASAQKALLQMGIAALRKTLSKVFTAVFALCLYAFPATAKTWQEAIVDVEALKYEYQETIFRRTGEWPSGWQGAMNVLRDADMHFCAILGRRLGFKDYIGHLEPPQPSHGSDIWDLTLHTVSLANWVSAAVNVGSLNPTRRAQFWNLECVGQGLVSNNLSVPVPDFTWFEVQNYQLQIYGDILPGFSQKLEEALNQNPNVTTISLGSGGGSVYEAIRAGIIIRQRGLDTQLYGSCMSACPLVFYGGVNRSMFRFSQRFGFHSVSSDGVAVPISDPVYQDIFDYISIMGGDPRLFIATMLKYEPSDMGFVTPYEECQMGLATWWQGYMPGECPRAGAPN